ncbi:LysR family transcriptional regulator [Morganella morganii]|nr:LysR family transcriptional regulator [Morganella morganii]
MAKHRGQIVADKNGLLLDNLFDVLVFVWVSETGNFTSAAEKLQISRSAAGKCLQRLENRVSTRLLHRTTRRLRLTEEGERFYLHAKRILSEVDDAENALYEGRQKPSGTLRIAVPVVFGRNYVMPVIQQYAAQWPDVDIDVSFSDDYCDLVQEGIDVAVRIGGNDDSRLVRKVLAPHRLVTCASPDYLERHGIPEAPEQLAAHECLIFRHRGRSVPWQFMRDKNVQLYPVSGRFSLGDTGAVLDAALADGGICQLGAFLAGPEIAKGVLQPVLTAFTPPGEPVCAVYPSKQFLAPKVREFLNTLETQWQGKAVWESPVN